MGRIRQRSTVFVAVVVAVVGMTVGACGDGDGGQAQVEPTPDDTAEPTPPPGPDDTAEPTVTPAPDQRIVNVYWLRDTQIAVGGRMVDMPRLAGGALDALLARPNELETDLGMVSAVPPGAEVLGLTIEAGVATVDFSAELEATGMGTAGETGLVSQVVFTLTQFPTVDEVDIVIEGEARDAILSHGLEAVGLTREDFLDAVSPAIVVESPYPGQPVTSPLTVTGFGRTFEGTVVYNVVVPPSGEIVADGFTTSAQPDAHLFGPFQFTAEFEAPVAGSGAIIVFEESARDGSQINIYQVPVMME